MSLSSLSVMKKLDVVDPCYNIHLYNCYLYMAVIDHLKSALNVNVKQNQYIIKFLITLQCNRRCST